MSILPPYLDALYGAEPRGAYMEVRFKVDVGMAQRFVRWEDREALMAFVRAQGQRSDTYLGVAPRRAERGSADAIERAHALWADVDTLAAQEALRRFSPPPSILIRSGRGLHAYWPLWPPLSPADVKRANRSAKRAWDESRPPAGRLPVSR
jgi:hypothetical protein